MHRGFMISKELIQESFECKNGKFYWKAIKPGVIIGKEAGTYDKKGYRCVVINRKSHKVHRLVFLYHYGYLPEIIDHINGVTDDNRIENLREATLSQNKFNRGKTKANTSGFKGVFKTQYPGKWRSQIKVNGKLIYLGQFNSKEDAYKKYLDAAQKYHGEFAHA
jgi:hypothetical protein